MTVLATRSAIPAGIADLVRTATESGVDTSTGERVLPVLPELRALLPAGGLRRGATIAVLPTPSVGSSILLALLAAASGAGSWCGVVGVPALGALAAEEMGVALDRLALVPHPGAEWATVVAALLDGLDVVVAAPPGPIAAGVAGRLAARARHRGAVLLPYGSWPGVDLSIEAVRGAWRGLDRGRGRLRWRELTLRARGRGSASMPREVNVWLPGQAPVVPMNASPMAGDAGPPPAVSGPAAGPDPIASADVLPFRRSAAPLKRAG